MDRIVEGGECPLTGWKVSDLKRKDYTWHYNVTCSNYSFYIWVSRNCVENLAVLDSKHLVRWLLFMGKIATINSIEDLNVLSNLLTDKKILDAISQCFVPQTPKEKSEQLLVLLDNVFPGFTGAIVPNDLFKLSFFKEFTELEIYLNYLSDSNYIKFNKINESVGFDDVIPFFLIDFKFHGIQQLALLEENGRNSKNCFIAMSFSERSEIIACKEAIKSAVNETKYYPIIINEKHIESELTINDAIIAEIKRAKFVIADFTEQKSGVYFEAGFALGLKIPVIYCCEEDDFKKNSHFDVNHYPHILYKTPEELRKGLIDKIRAWID